MTSKKNTILVVDDDEKIRFAFGEVLRTDGFTCITASDGDEAIQAIQVSAPVVVFMDITMPRLNGLDALKRIKEFNPQLPVILITGFGVMETAIKAIQFGAFDYLTKPLDVPKIREVLRRALASTRMTPLPASDAARPEVLNRYEIVGRSPRMQEIYKLIGSISTTPNHTHVLVLGESGTGKELVARAIHGNGPNAEQPFIGINCTVLPEHLLESELFGHAKGAFTGAHERKLGKFEVAGNGTIFLDEIGNLTPHLQQKLLRVLQEREFERIGENTPIQVHARFITASNQDLLSEIKGKRFREDLYFRLNVAAVQLPPLRERRDDIPLLADYFLAKYNKQLNKAVKGFSERALAFLMAYPYPGNVRELENMLERAVMLTNGEIILEHVFSDHGRPAGNGDAPAGPSTKFSEARDQVIEAFEKQFITTMLEDHQGNVAAAAEASAMTRQNFQRLMIKHQISAVPYRK